MNGHPTREEDFDLYALGALEGDEKLAIESHIASCTDCARKLAEARGRISLLAFAAPTVAPSAAVKQRLMQQVRASAQSRTPARAPRIPAGGIFGRWWTAVLVPAAAALAIATIFLWTQKRQLDRQLAELRTRRAGPAKAIDRTLASRRPDHERTTRSPSRSRSSPASRREPRMSSTTPKWAC